MELPNTLIQDFHYTSCFHCPYHSSSPTEPQVASMCPDLSIKSRKTIWLITIVHCHPVIGQPPTTPNQYLTIMTYNMQCWFHLLQHLGLLFLSDMSMTFTSILFQANQVADVYDFSCIASIISHLSSKSVAFGSTRLCSSQLRIQEAAPGEH
jgi:hypothetical protein